MTFVLFLAKLQPELVAIARDLYRWYVGNPEAAKAALRRIPNWGAFLEEALADNDRRMEALRRAQRESSS